MDSGLPSINAKLAAQHHLIQALSITQAEHTGGARSGMYPCQQAVHRLSN